ncbi:flagellar M-ring protein FliF [Microbacterium protaetiae]|uniref:Flagellar M-ring protein n=1 Tax=Microbacterium protaetiae TaxID=2509458 RepID=A0A4P6EE84_9MICO|nr:flagellar basal-body MS-ring/collar protein FliF [Microbacterium protaetiae]QAY60076.1 flagellar M-ring protein FliF [Microbacterium protaetiae]
MPPSVTSALHRLGRFISGFTLAQRTIAIIGLAAVILGGVALFSWMSRPDYSPLFSGLSASDANAVVEQLRSDSVPYELADGGSTVLVPKEEVYDQRLAAASAGLPTSSSGGYTLLDKMGVTASEFQQSVTYKRAIEGELADTIASMDGVTAASVKLAIPEESVFVSQTQDPTASVFVEVSDRSTLSSQKVEAIVHLTSAAVTGLKPENVAVVDQAGHTLSAAGTGTSGGVDEQAGDYESRVAASVQKMLDAVVGPGNATVTVTADIDRSSNQRQDETYAPADGAPPASEQTKTQTSKGSSTDAGVLGPDNIAVPSGDDADSDYQSTETTRNNVINKTTQTTTTPAGKLRRQSVSVAVDSAAAGSVDADQLRELVSTAAGIDTKRGDAVTVEFVPFSQTESKAAQDALKAAKDAADAERAATLRNTIIIAAAIALPLLIALVVFVVRARRRSRDDEFGDPTYVPLLEGKPRSLLAPTDAGLAVRAQPDPVAALLIDDPVPEPGPEPDDDLERELEPAQMRLERRRHEIDALARQDPHRTADLLRDLLEERQDA